MVAGQGTYMITHCDFSIYDTTTWVLDIGSLFKLLQRLQVSRKIENHKRFLNIGDKNYVPILVLGIIESIFNSNHVVLVIIIIV